MTNTAILGSYGDSSGSGLMFRNKLINGNFDVWQRATTAPASSGSRYVADRWLVTATGTTAAVSRQAFANGQTEVVGNPKYFNRITTTSVPGANNYCVTSTAIEDVLTLSGQVATISFWAKADAPKNIAIEFAQNFGAGGGASTRLTNIGVTTFSLTTSWNYFTATVLIPSISAKTIGTNLKDCLEVLFWLESGSGFASRNNSLGQQSGTFDIASVQLECGRVATPFEQRHFGLELNLCQRYYEKSWAYNVAAGTAGVYVGRVVVVSSATGGDPLPNIRLKQSKRGNPTVIVYNSVTAAAGKVRRYTGSVDTVATVVEASTEAIGMVSGTFAASSIYDYHYTAEFELID